MSDHGYTPRKILGLRQGVGIVVADMIGAGVFLSAGFMAQDLGPAALLLAWLVGAGIALAGTRAYAAVAEIVPRSGGEYRYLSELLHPALGYLAGWASLLLGFSTPVAVDAIAVGAFAQTLHAGLPARPIALAAIALLTALHALDLRASKWTQDLLVWVKVALVIGFVALGLVAGRNQWPTWQPPHLGTGFPLAAFMGSLFFIAFAFSGWNAAVYVAEEFEQPRRDVPRSMFIGCGLVAVLYLLVNWVFVANLTPERAAVVFEYEQSRITLGHLIAQDLIGAGGGAVMSVLTIVAFLSAMSAMMMIGPRVCAAMARDGFLPRVFADRSGRPPVGSVLLQGAIAVLLVFTQQLQQVLTTVGAILTLFSALVAAALFRVRFSDRPGPRPSAGALTGAAVYIISAAWMLYFGFRDSPGLLLWLGGVAVIALVAYLATGRRHRQPAT
ncbi:MAG: APC family permease [Deltaproteobacteria bacterium]|nr:APC family permease [Deltaproteobacteria bacterium]